VVTIVSVGKIIADTVTGGKVAASDTLATCFPCLNLLQSIGFVIC